MSLPVENVNLFLFLSFFFVFYIFRHDRITTFTPEKFWFVEPRVERDGQGLVLKWSRGHLFDQEVATTFLKIVKEATIAK